MDKETLDASLTKLYGDLPRDRRFEEVTIDDQTVFDSIFASPERKNAVESASIMVEDYLKGLGINHSHKFDHTRTIFLPNFIMRTIGAQGEYHHGDIVFMGEEDEANVPTIIHEFVHASSSQWRFEDENELTLYIQERKQGSKSGFDRANFHWLNEGITELITNTIVAENLEKCQELTKAFQPHLPDILDTEEHYFARNLSERIERRKEDFKPIFDRYYQALESAHPDSKQLLLDAIDGLTATQESMIQNLITAEKDYHAIVIKNIHEKYTDPYTSRGSYLANISIVDMICIALAKNAIKTEAKEGSLEDIKNEMWKELQIAYFGGNTMYLRKIDRAMGQGFLRSMEEINFDELSPEDEKALLHAIKNKINTM